MIILVGLLDVSTCFVCKLHDHCFLIGLSLCSLYDTDVGYDEDIVGSTVGRETAYEVPPQLT